MDGMNVEPNIIKVQNEQTEQTIHVYGGFHSFNVTFTQTTT